jgi:hypothetical protein
MYLITAKRKNKNGSVVEYYQPAHNERHPVTRKPVAKIIHNFGEPRNWIENNWSDSVGPLRGSAA